MCMIDLDKHKLTWIHTVLAADNMSSLDSASHMAKEY